MFEDATFHSRNILPSQTPKWMLLTLAINLTILTAFLLLPLLNPQGLPNRLLHRILYAPPIQPTIVVEHLPQTVASTPQSTASPTNPLRSPTIPSARLNLSTEAPPTGDTGLSDPLSTVGSSGSPNSGPSTSIFRTSAQPLVQQTPAHPLNISKGVSEGLLLSKTTPTYPVIAKMMHTSGTVTLAATISPTGSIENLQVLSGPLPLRQAALDAVKTWRYRPYLLNNQPVEVETTINIQFSLTSQ
jgi:protein TonB